LAALSPGQTFGRYEIEALLGAGGMGEVYRARDSKLRRHVALKVIHADRQEEGLTQGIVSRFTREAQAAAALAHTNVVTVFDIGEIDGTPFIAMELLDGVTRRAEIHRSASLAKRLQWLLEIARALSTAHALGVIHRDIKPDNVMICSGHVKVLDFGIAKWIDDVVGDASPRSDIAPSTRTGTGHHVGTPRYMAPEQTRGRTVDARADQFAWGIVAYELCARVHPQERAIGFGRDTDWAAPPMPLSELVPELPFGVSAIVMKTLQRHADDRFEKLDDVVTALAPIVTRALAEEGDASPGSPSDDALHLEATQSPHETVTSGVDSGTTLDETTVALPPAVDEATRGPAVSPRRSHRLVLAIVAIGIALVIALVVKRARDPDRDYSSVGGTTPILEAGAPKEFAANIRLMAVGLDAGPEADELTNLVRAKEPAVEACYERFGIELLRDITLSTHRILLRVEPDGRIAGVFPYAFDNRRLDANDVSRCIQAELLALRVRASGAERNISLVMTVAPLKLPPRTAARADAEAAADAPLKENDPRVEFVMKYSVASAPNHEDKHIFEALAPIHDDLAECRNKTDWLHQTMHLGLVFSTTFHHDGKGNITKREVFAEHLPVIFNVCARKVLSGVKAFAPPRGGVAGAVNVTMVIAMQWKADAGRLPK
jgi:serine/threonine protein kinase